MARQNIAPKQVKGRLRREKAAKEPKVIENTKKVLCIRGKNTSETVNIFLRDMYRLKLPHSRMLSKKNDISAFEDETKLDFITTKNDSSLFFLGTSNKKRPNNIIMGRMFDGHVLDMIEFGISDYKGFDEFKGVAKRTGSRPAMLFEGDLWDNDAKFGKWRNLFIDFFRGDVKDGIGLAAIDHIMVITAVEDNRVLLRHYLIGIKKSGDQIPLVDLEPMGPSADLMIRRTKFASSDLWKLATPKSKQTKPKKVKNVSRNEMGDTIGRVHLGKQDLTSMKVRRVKALRTSGKRKLEKSETNDINEE